VNILIIGPPGAGKGTQSAMIYQKYNIIQISTGDILRANVKENTKLGILAKEYMTTGRLVPDDLIIDMMKEEIIDPKYKPGFILDGFPRTIDQADALCRLLSILNIQLNKVLLLKVPSDFIVERMSGRRTCRNCNKTYHIKFNPPPMNGECDCGNSDLFQREDDKEETVLHRLEVYRQQTSPLIEYYQKKNKVIEIDGTLEVDKVFSEIEKVLK
jgi:adenylate kinase